MEFYTTLPLRPKSRDIRLLELESSEHDDAPIVAKVRVVSLDDKPFYFALSYTWGELRFDHSIKCNGFSYAVTENLFMALKRLRKSEKKILWVDQISINQSDEAERNQQVSFMHSIYQAAENVCVWLGAHGEGTGLGLELAHRLSSTLNEASKLEQVTEFLSMVEFDEVYAIEAFNKIYESPWFHRCWVVQEVAAKRSPIAFMGDYEFDWNILPLAALARSIYMSVTIPMARKAPPSDMAERGSEFCQSMAFVFGHLASSIRLDDSVAKSAVADTLNVASAGVDTVGSFLEGATMLATEPRDKVYAFLGLVKELHNIIVPKYALTIRETYLNLSRCLIMGKGLGSSVVANAGLARRRMDRLPSWCLDLSHLESNEVSLTRLAELHKLHLEADKSSTGKYALSAADDELTVRGLRVDTVMELSSVNLNGDNVVELPWLNDMGDFIANFSAVLRQRYGTPGEQLKAFSRLIIADGQRFSQTAYESYLAYVAHREKLYQIKQRYDAAPGPFTSQLLDNFEWPQSIAEYMVLLENITYTRRVCVTNSGFLALVPDITQIGDEVWVVFGCGVPLLMREAPAGKSKRVLVDSIFVLGLMDGEALAMDHLHTRDVVLQ